MTRARLLMILLGLLCAALIYAWTATPQQKRVENVVGKQLNSADGSVSQVEIAPEIADLDFSGGVNNSYQQPKRNLFAALYQPPKVAVKRPTPKLKPRPKVAKVVTKVVKPIVRAPQPSGSLSLKPLKVLGYLDNGGQRTVFLTGRKDKIFLVKEGDIFADGLEVSEISQKNITIVKKATGQQLSLPLGVAKNQRLPKVKINSGRPKASFPTPNTKGNDGGGSQPSDPRKLFGGKPKEDK